MLAIIKTGGKQYKVEVGDKIKVEKLEGEEGGNIVFDEVLFVGDDKEVKVGTPAIKGAKVEAKVLDQGRAKKVRVVKYKNKTRQYTSNGHRQSFTKVKISKI